MKLFIVALSGTEHPTMPQFARDALACAKLNSGMDVIALTDHEEKGWINAAQYMSRAIHFRRAFKEVCGIEPREIPAILRWFIIEDYIRAHSIKPPFMQIDWEVMVFGDLEDHCRKAGAEGGDYGDMVNDEYGEIRGRTIPYWINNMAAVSFFTALVEAHVKARTPLMVQHKCGGDMNWWEHARIEGCFTPVDISREIGDSIFDLNVSLRKDIYASTIDSKTLIWKNGIPHFTRRSDQSLVRVVALHCFWTWKEKTGDILYKTQTKFSDALS